MKLKTVELTKEQQKAIEWLDDAAGVSPDDIEYVYATRIFNLLHQMDDGTEIASEDCKRYRRLYEDTAAQLEALKKSSVTDKYPVCTVSGKALFYTASSEDYDELIQDIADEAVIGFFDNCTRAIDKFTPAMIESGYALESTLLRDLQRAFKDHYLRLKCRNNTDITHKEDC